MKTHERRQSEMEQRRNRPLFRFVDTTFNAVTSLILDECIVIIFSLLLTIYLMILAPIPLLFCLRTSIAQLHVVYRAIVAH